MKEYKIGETFTFTDDTSCDHKLLTKEAYHGNSCDGCFFYLNDYDCVQLRDETGLCYAFQREDGKYVIFEEVKQ